MGAATTGYRPQGAFPGQPPQVREDQLVGVQVEIEPKEEGMFQSTKGQLPKKKRVRRVPPGKPMQHLATPGKPPQKPAGKRSLPGGMNDTENPTNPFPRKKKNPLASMMGE